MNKRGSTRAWRVLRARVLREEPICRIRGPKCTHLSTTVDHVQPRSLRPDLTMVRSNLRGACAPCNYGRGNGTRTSPARTQQSRPQALVDFFEPGDTAPPPTLGV